MCGREELGLTAMSVASISGTLALCSCEDPGSEKVSSGTVIHQDAGLDQRRGRLQCRMARGRFRQDANLIHVDETTRAPRESLAQQFIDTVPASAAATFHRYYEF